MSLKSNSMLAFLKSIRLCPPLDLKWVHKSFKIKSNWGKGSKTFKYFCVVFYYKGGSERLLIGHLFILNSSLNQTHLYTFFSGRVHRTNRRQQRASHSKSRGANSGGSGRPLVWASQTKTKMPHCKSLTQSMRLTREVFQGPVSISKQFFHIYVIQTFLWT